MYWRAIKDEGKLLLTCSWIGWLRSLGCQEFIITPQKHSAWPDISPHSKSNAISALLRHGLWPHSIFKCVVSSCISRQRLALKTPMYAPITKWFHLFPVKPFPNSQTWIWLSSSFKQSCLALIFPTTPHEDKWLVLCYFSRVSISIMCFSHEPLGGCVLQRNVSEIMKCK